MKVSCYSALLLLITSISTPAAFGQSDSKAQYQAVFGAYKECMEAAAVAYAAADASPNEIADASQSKCGRESSELESFTESYFSSRVSRGGKDMAIGRARAFTTETKQIMRDRVIQFVIEERIGK